jgi:hypothetical protein
MGAFPFFVVPYCWTSSTAKVLMSHHQVRVPPRHCDAQGMLHASRPQEYAEDAFLA